MDDREIEELKAKIKNIIHSPRIFSGEFARYCGITPQNLLEKLGGIIPLSRQLQRFRHTLPPLITKKEEFKETPLHPTTERYPYNCFRCARYTKRILERYRFPARIVRIDFPEEVPHLDWTHHYFVITEVAGKEVIVDMSADQFEPIDLEKNEFTDVGIVIIPLEIARANPDRFWMYTEKPTRRVALKYLFEKLLSSTHKLRESLISGNILELVPEWKEWINLYKNENFRVYHPVSPEEHILIALRRLESTYFQRMIEKQKLTEDNLKALRCALLLHDFGEILVLKEDPGYSRTIHLQHPEKSVEVAESILYRLGYSSYEIETTLLLIRYHSVLADLARYGYSQVSPLEFVKVLRSKRNLNLLRILQLIDAASVRQEFSNSLSIGLERRINEIAGLIEAILVSKGKKRRRNEDRLLNYLQDVQRQNAEIEVAFNNLKGVLKKEGIKIDERLLQAAFLAMHRSHLGQLRKDEWTPFVIHCIETAIILVEELKIRHPEWIVAALLHDVLEDTRTSSTALEELFGKNVIHMIQLLSKPDERAYATKYQRDRDYLHRLIYGTDEIHDRYILTAAQTIKIADRIQNLRTLDTKVKGFSQKIIDGTYEIFIPYFIGETEVLSKIKRILIRELIKSGVERGLLTSDQVELLELLSREIVDFKIPDLMEVSNPFSFIKGLIRHIRKEQSDIPLVFAFDGMSGVGRTTFAATLKEYLQKCGYHVVVFDVNDYLKPRKLRNRTLKLARATLQQFYEQRERLYDFDRFKEEVIDRIMAFRNSTAPYIEFSLCEIYDRETGDLSREKSYRIERDTIVLIEGIHILQEEFLPAYDTTFLLYAPREVCLKNVILRERAKPKGTRQPTRKLIDRFNFIDWPSYKKHWIEYWLNSGFIIDNTDYRTPVLKRNPFPRFPDKAPWVPSPLIEPERSLQDNLERLFARLRRIDIHPDKAVSGITDSIGILRNLLAVRGIEKIIPQYIDIPLVDAELETLDLFIEQLLTLGDLESTNILFRLLLIYLLEEAPMLTPDEGLSTLSIENPGHLALFKRILKAVQEKREITPPLLPSLWSEDTEIPILLDIDSIREEPLTTLLTITRLGINLAPNQRIHLILTHSTMDKAEIKRVFRPFYKAINLGRRKTKKSKIRISFEPNNLRLNRAGFSKYLRYRLESRKIPLPEALLVTTEINYPETYSALDTGRRLIYRAFVTEDMVYLKDRISRLTSYTNELLLKSPFGEELARQEIATTLKKCSLDQAQDSLTRSMAWHALEDSGMNEEFKGKVVYSLNTLLNSNLNNGNTTSRLKNLVERTKGRVVFYIGKDILGHPEYAFLKDSLITMDKVKELLNTGELVVFMLNSEDREDLGVDGVTPWQLVANRFIVPIEYLVTDGVERDVENDLYIGLEIVRNRGVLKECMPSQFYFLLKNAIQQWLKANGIEATPNRIQKVIGPPPIVRYDIDSIAESYEYIKGLITSA